MDNNISTRAEVPLQETWNLSDIFTSESELYSSVEILKEKASIFYNTFLGNIIHSEDLVEALESYEDIEKRVTLIRNYVDLDISVDQTNIDSQKRVDNINTALSEVQRKTSFIYIDITKLSESEIEKVYKLKPDLTPFIRRIYLKKQFMLTHSDEETIASLSPVFKMARVTYDTAKLVDMNFPNFNVGEEEFKLSYNSFENDWEVEPNTKIRRKAFLSFHNKLNQYKHTTAKTYDMQLKIEKINSDLRGYPNVFEYLLSEQEVDKKIFDRQIDITMQHLAPHMRRYAKILKEVHNLEKMTFADLKIPLDPNYEPQVSFEETKEYIYESLNLLGTEYTEIVKDAYEKRWIDYAQNIGKSTGAFCYTPYGSHPFIFLYFTGKMKDVFVLAHELGHAGHFHLANKNQHILNSIPSVYFFEAPSTMNEMLLAHHLLRKSEDMRFKRWVISTVISRTYFHNFVTHLLEAAFQREVYQLVDKGKSITTDLLCTIKRNLLEEFWGEDVEINEGAELTWMRQPHYYLGLYPYTYSTGLTIATQVSKRILKEGKPVIDKWLDALRAGGSKSPVELSHSVGVDIQSDRPLLDSISYVGELIDELYDMTKKLGDVKF